MSRISSSSASIPPTRPTISRPAAASPSSPAPRPSCVRGAEPVTLALRETRHGPVISDLGGAYAEPAAAGTVLALQATFLAGEDRTPDALGAVNRAARLGRVPRRAQGFRRTRAEHGLCRYRRQYRLHRARPRADPRQGRRLAAGAGLERRVRLDRLHSLRAAAQRLQPAQRPLHHRQQQDRPRRLSLLLGRGWDLPYRAERIAAAARCDAAAIAGGLGRDPGRHAVAHGARICCR